MKIPIRVQATRPVAPILFRHVAAAVALPLAAAAFAWAVTWLVLQVQFSH